MARKHIDSSECQRGTSSTSEKSRASSLSKARATRRDFPLKSEITKSFSLQGEYIDLDATAEPCQVDSIISRPGIKSQLSVLSTDSGFLPRDIQDSSFVDDVIEELNSKGISQSDIISCQDCNNESNNESLPCKASSKDLPSRLVSTCKHKSRNSSQFDRIESPTKKKALTTSEFKMVSKSYRREKNNAASRKSRASRKMNTLIKEEEIANLQEESQRLAIILHDFTSIAATCKQWIVLKMENPD